MQEVPWTSIEGVRKARRRGTNKFQVVREKFDPKGMFKSVIGEILGLYD